MNVATYCRNVSLNYSLNSFVIVKDYFYLCKIQEEVLEALAYRTDKEKHH